MSRATSPVALSFGEFLVKILKPENDGVLELVKNVSCNPNTAGLYLLESRVSSSKLAWNPRKFHRIIIPLLQSGEMDSSSDRQKKGLKEPDFALPSSTCPKLQAWVVPGACWKEWSAWGAKTPRRPPEPHPPSS